MIYSWKKILRGSIPLLTLCILIEIFAGQMLQSGQKTLIALPIFLVSIPVINGVGGNIGSILGARLASGLHVGYIKLDLKDKKMRDNISTSMLIGVFTYFVLAILIYFILSFINVEMGASLVEFVSIMLGAGFLLILIVAFFSVFTALWSFKKGFDPDDMVAPVVTTIGDTFGILFLFIIIRISGVGI